MVDTASGVGGLSDSLRTMVFNQSTSVKFFIRLRCETQDVLMSQNLRCRREPLFRYYANNMVHCLDHIEASE